MCVQCYDKMLKSFNCKLLISGMLRRRNSFSTHDNIPKHFNFLIQNNFVYLFLFYKWKQNSGDRYWTVLEEDVVFSKFSGIEMGWI